MAHRTGTSSVLDVGRMFVFIVGAWVYMLLPRTDACYIFKIKLWEDKRYDGSFSLSRGP